MQQTAPGQCQLYIEVEVMKTLSGHRAPCCYKHEFRDKTMEYLNRYRAIIIEHSGLNDKENCHFHCCTLLFKGKLGI